MRICAMSLLKNPLYFILNKREETDIILSSMLGGIRLTVRSRKRNDFLDLMRFVSCLFVVLSHCPLPGRLGKGVIAVGHYAVPFFLMISGWYSFSDDRDVMLKKAKKQLSSTLKLIAVFCAAYFVMNSLCAMIGGRAPFGWIREYCDLTTVLCFLLFNRALFLGSSAYYIFMLLYVYILFLVCLKYNVHKYILYAAPGLIVVTILCGEFAELPWYLYGNFLFTGLPCFAIGHLLHKYEEGISHISRKKWIAAFVLGLLLTWFEACATKEAFCYFGSVLLAVSLLMICVGSSGSHLPRITQAVHKYATAVFVVHCGIRDVVKAALWRWDMECSNYLFPFVVFGLSLLAGILWEKVYRKGG